MIIHEWVQAIWRQRSAGGRFGGGPGRNVSAKELARFFEHDLSKEKQDELSRITDKEEQHRELRKLYFQHIAVRPSPRPTPAAIPISKRAKDRFSNISAVQHRPPPRSATGQEGLSPQR